MRAMKQLMALLCLFLIIESTFGGPVKRKPWRPSNPRESRNKEASSSDDITTPKTVETETKQQVNVNDAISTTTTSTSTTTEAPKDLITNSPDLAKEVSSPKTEILETPGDALNQPKQAVELIKNAEIATTTTISMNGDVKPVDQKSNDGELKAIIETVVTDSKPAVVADVRNEAMSTGTTSTVTKTTEIPKELTSELKTVTKTSTTEAVLSTLETTTTEKSTSEAVNTVQLVETSSTVQALDTSTTEKLSSEALTTVQVTEKSTSEVHSSTEASSTDPSTTEKFSSEAVTSTEASTTSKLPETTENTLKESDVLSFEKLAYLIRTDTVEPVKPETSKLEITGDEISHKIVRRDLESRDEPTTERVFVVGAQIYATEAERKPTRVPAASPRSLSTEAGGFFSRLAENLATGVKNLFLPNNVDKIVVSEMVSVSKVVNNGIPVEAKDILIKKPLHLQTTPHSILTEGTTEGVNTSSVANSEVKIETVTTSTSPVTSFEATTSPATTSEATTEAVSTSSTEKSLASTEKVTEKSTEFTTFVPETTTESQEMTTFSPSNEKVTSKIEELRFLDLLKEESTTLEALDETSTVSDELTTAVKEETTEKVTVTSTPFEKKNSSESTTPSSTITEKELLLTSTESALLETTTEENDSENEVFTTENFLSTDSTTFPTTTEFVTDKPVKEKDAKKTISGKNKNLKHFPDYIPVKVIKENKENSRIFFLRKIDLNAVTDAPLPGQTTENVVTTTETSTAWPTETTEKTVIVTAVTVPIHLRDKYFGTTTESYTEAPTTEDISKENEVTLAPTTTTFKEELGKVIDDNIESIVKKIEEKYQAKNPVDAKKYPAPLKSNELRDEIIKAHKALRLLKRPVVTEQVENHNLDPVKEYVLITKQIEKIPSSVELKKSKETDVKEILDKTVKKVDSIVQDFKQTTSSTSTWATTNYADVDLDSIVTVDPTEVVVEVPIPSDLPYESPPISEEFGRFFSHFN